MYGTILFWVGFSNNDFLLFHTIFRYAMLYGQSLWHVGAIMTVLGGSWFWFFLRVDVYSEAQPWYQNY